MSYHHTCVDTSIRSSSTNDICRDSKNSAKATLNLTLHGNTVWLDLPPVKTSSIV